MIAHLVDAKGLLTRTNEAKTQGLLEQKFSTLALRNTPSTRQNSKN